MSNIQLVVKQDVSPPSYLEAFEKDNIHLIFAKKPSLTGENEDILIESYKDNSIHEESIDKCDLTGDPLEVDLGENDSIQIIRMEETIHKWSVGETKHFPLSVRDARRELNKILKNPCENKSFFNKSIYILCNGNDSKRTVLLGCNRSNFMSCSIHLADTILQTDVEGKINEMVQDHLTNCSDQNKQVIFSVRTTYNLYGKSLRHISIQNASMRQLSTHGSIYMDTVSSERLFKISESDKAHMNMHLEVVAGHPCLSLNPFWNELVQLQYLIDILCDSELSSCESTIISKDPLEQDVILQALVELVSSKFLRRELEANVVNLQNLRQDDLLDGLWRILNRCETVSDLRSSFNFFFDELTEGAIRMLPVKDDSSKVSMIIKSILQGKLGLSASLAESIEFLFELGAQKLKFDFQVILTQLAPQVKSVVESVWKEINQEASQTVKKSRKTRATRAKTLSGMQNLSVNINHLAYLSQLYVGSEFLYLLKEQVNLNEEGYHQFSRYIEKEYISDRNKIADFNLIFQSPLREISFDVDLRNVHILESVHPSRWTVSMESDNISTIYDLSDSPTFPPNIYDYDMPTDTEEIIYFVSKMYRSTGMF